MKKNKMEYLAYMLLASSVLFRAYISNKDIRSDGYYFSFEDFKI